MAHCIGCACHACHGEFSWIAMLPAPHAATWVIAKMDDALDEKTPAQTSPNATEAELDRVREVNDRLELALSDLRKERNEARAERDGLLAENRELRRESRMKKVGRR